MTGSAARMNSRFTRTFRKGTIDKFTVKYEESRSLSRSPFSVSVRSRFFMIMFHLVPKAEFVEVREEEVSRL